MRQWVTVVAFIRVYDPDTRRWFCDIDMDIGEAYLPFVRPALMRYQPHEWPGCVLSRILLANIVQTLPDRTLTVAHAPDAAEQRQIIGLGLTYTAIRLVGEPRSDGSALARTVARLSSGAPQSPTTYSIGEPSTAPRSNSPTCCRAARRHGVAA